MKMCVRSSVHPTDDIGVVEKEARGLSGLDYHAMPRRICAQVKRHYGEISSQRENA
jgi:hypothetical protein